MLKKFYFKNHIIDFNNPILMGIINVTDNSFFDGSDSNFSKETILKKAKDFIDNGFEILDIGAQSTKPGVDFIDPKVEEKRIVDSVKIILDHYPNAVISVDTFRANVAYAALNNGAQIINDISSWNLDPEMFPFLCEYKPTYIFMHMQGTPKTMQIDPQYSDLIQEITLFLLNKKDELLKNGLTQIIADPGFGFGKTISHNYAILKNFNKLKTLDIPLLAGVSRKSMFYKSLNLNPDQSLNGSVIGNTLALVNGANILRVHDVKEYAQLIKIFKFYSDSV